MKQTIYDTLPLEDCKRLGELIREENLKRSEQYYPEPQIRDSFYTRYGKRTIDIILSSVGLLVTLPINLLIGIVTFFDVGRPLFFKQIRIGKDGKLFTLIKFRSMNNNTNENGVLLRAEKRVTKWGKFIRATSLDELLNFVSILKGDMSIIGPRPLPEVYKGRFNKYHEARHSVRPGLDCPLRDSSKTMTWKNRLENDSWYAQNISLLTDIKLIFLLVKETLHSNDKEARAGGFSEGTFMGYFDNGEIMDSNHIPAEFYDKLFQEKQNQKR